MVHIIDVSSLVSELPGDKPCGEDLEYDPEFGELQRAAQPKAEQQFGDTIIAAEEPDWRAVKEKGLSLLQRTRDLRVGVLLTRALLRTDGFRGLGDGLELVETLVRDRWDQVHPQLDPDDDNDPVLRVNTIANLCGQEILRPIHEAELVTARGLGSFSLHDLQVAKGEASPREGESAPDASAIDAAFLGCELDELQENASAVESALERARSIESVLTDRVGTSQSIDMDGLTSLLRKVREVLAAQLSRRGVGDADVPGGSDEGGGGHDRPGGPDHLLVDRCHRRARHAAGDLSLGAGGPRRNRSAAVRALKPAAAACPRQRWGLASQRRPSVSSSARCRASRARPRDRRRRRPVDGGSCARSSWRPRAPGSNPARRR